MTTTRPCTCDRFRPGEPFTPADCRLCYLYAADPRYRALWSDPSPPPSRSTTPPGDLSRSTTPPGDLSRSTTPPGDLSRSTTPPGGKLRKTAERKGCGCKGKEKPFTLTNQLRPQIDTRPG